MGPGQLLFFSLTEELWLQSDRNKIPVQELQNQFADLVIASEKWNE